jgi:hypothetical protein
LYSVPWLRVGWYRKRQALPWWFMGLQAGGMVVFCTLVEGWMVQEEAGSPLVVYAAPGRYSVPWLRVGWYRKRQALPWWFMRLQAG